MNLKSLQIFINVMEEGTLARAAARMNQSPSAASRLLRLLEEEFDVTLFHRDRKRLVPTPEADAFYPEALRLSARIASLPTLFGHLRSHNAAPLRLLCHPRVVNGLVLPALRELSAILPAVRTKLEIVPRRVLGRQITYGQFDVAIATLPLPVQGLAPEPLGICPLKIALPRGHALATRGVLCADDLADEAYIALDAGTVVRQRVDDALSTCGRPLQITHEVSAGAAAYRMVRDGLGFSFVDAVALDPELAGSVVLVGFEPAIDIAFGFYRPAGVRSHGAAEAFGEVLETVFSTRAGSSNATRGR